MKKTDSTKDALGLVIKGQKDRSKSRRPKKDPDASISNACYYCKKPWHIKKNCMKCKEMLKKKGGKNSDELVLVESQNKLVLLKKQMRIHVMS